MRKKIFVLLVLLTIIGVGFFIYQKYYQKNISTNSKKLIYNSEVGRWEETSKIDDPIESDRETILKNDDNKNGLHNATIMRAYFDKYDENNQELSVKYLVALTQGIYDEAKLKLSPNQTIYCAPEIYTDPNNGEAHDLKKLILPVKTGATLWVPTEKTISFNDFINKIDEKTFLYIQLTKDYDSQGLNYIQKLIAIGLCE